MDLEVGVDGNGMELAVASEDHSLRLFKMSHSA